MKLLLIEDDKPSLKALEATLKMLGFDSEAFSDPEEAIARFQSENDFDVVITDLKMPKLSGVEVLNKIHSMDSVIPVIIITAHRDHPQLNTDLVFYKPVDINALVKYLKQL
jgi:DNA-binding NtrC family response regulator